jgi:hypothetical protein
LCSTTTVVDAGAGAGGGACWHPTTPATITPISSIAAKFFVRIIVSPSLNIASAKPCSQHLLPSDAPLLSQAFFPLKLTQSFAHIFYLLRKS